MGIELGRTLDKTREELVRRRTRDRLVLFDSARGEVLPEVAPIPPPLLTVGHQAEVGALVKAARRSFMMINNQYPKLL